MLKPIKVQKNYEAVIEQIIDIIKKRNLLPGDRLDSIEKLSDSLGVSRSVVREALASLRAMGLVKIVQGEGTFIADFDPTSLSIPVTTGLLMQKEHIKELFEVRKILEVGAVRLAAQHHTMNDLVIIESVLSEMSVNDAAINEENDYRFHHAIIKASQNDMLLSLLSSISDIMIETIYQAQQVIVSSEQEGKRLVEEHKLIFDAIKNKDASLATTYMLRHLEGVEDSLEL